ncbi:MAG: ABC transporter substrate-binding protein [Chloroflexota bacterium]|nr:ABC transporter substrate-binding protein [Chloroflexota bacterium]
MEGQKGSDTMTDISQEKHHLSRRRFLGASAGAAVAALLAACGGSSATDTPKAAVTGTAAVGATTAPVVSATTAPAATVPGAAATAPTAATVAPAATTGVSATTAPATTSGAVVEVSFFYPVAVGGPITKIIDGYAADFTKANPGIKVTPTYAGSYTDTLTKIQTTIDGGGQPPDVAVSLSTDLYALKDADSIIPLDDYIKTADPAYITDFYDAFMLNSKDGGKVYGIPFQRSTPVLYYNKDLFKEVGLNPEQSPKTWAEMVDAAKKLTKPDGSRWGVEIPSDGFPYWVFQGMAIGNGKNLVDDTGTKTFFNDPAVVQALDAWVGLGTKDKVEPASIVIWNTTPDDFLGGKAGMVWHTTGSLTNILKNAKFPVGVGYLPGLKQPGAPTGGGNFYLFKKTPKEKQAAAWKFVQFMSSPEYQAKWTIDSGYVAPRKSAWETPALKDYTAKNPQALVARDQLQYASRELATHSGPQIQKVFGDELQAALTSKKQPQAAMDDAQKNADNILKQFR